MDLSGNANRGSVSTGYEIENSCLFDSASSHKMHFTAASASSTAEQQKGTFSFWIKRTKLGMNGARIIGFGETDGYNSRMFLRFLTADTLHFYPILTWTTERVFRDVSAWYHIVIMYDTTQNEQDSDGSSDTNHAQDPSTNPEGGSGTAQTGLWINGVRMGNDNGLPHGNTAGRTKNSTSGWGRNLDKHAIGYDELDNTGYGDFYLAEFHAIQGVAVQDPDDFGEFNDDGIWIPKKYTGTAYGTNGFYLKFDDSSNMGNDSSSEGNDFTLTNMGAANQMEDSPTNNFCTLNPLHRQNPEAGTGQTISMGNLKSSQVSTQNYNTISSTMGVGSGKWYYEVKIVESDENSSTLQSFNQIIHDSDSPRIRGYNNRTKLSWDFGASGTTYHYDETGNWHSNHLAGLGHPPYHGTYEGYILLMALDMDNGNVWVGYGGESGEITGSNPGSWDGASSPRWERTTAAQTASAQGDPGNNLYPTNYGTEDGSQSAHVISIKTRGIDLCHTAFSWYSSTNAERAFIVNYGCPPPGWTINSGNADANGYGNFEFPPPTGFYALCSQNLAEFG